MSRNFREYAAENGWLLLFRRIVTGTVYRLRDRSLGRRLNCPLFRTGKDPRMAGLRHMQIGRDFSAGNFLWLDAITRHGENVFTPLITIGEGARLSDSVHIACTNRVSIGANFLCGARVLITDHNHGDYSGPEQSRPDSVPNERRLTSNRAVTIGSNVFLGDNVVVLPGARIGDGAIIGANSVVSGKIPPATISLGYPAKPITQWNETAQSW